MLTHLGAVLGLAPVGKLRAVDVAHGGPSIPAGLAGRPVQAVGCGGRNEGGEEQPGDERLHFQTADGSQSSNFVQEMGGIHFSCLLGCLPHVYV